MIYCYLNINKGLVKSYIKDEKLNTDIVFKEVQFNELQEKIQNKENGFLVLEISSLEELLDLFEIIGNEINSNNRTKLYLTLRNCSICNIT